MLYRLKSPGSQWFCSTVCSSTDQRKLHWPLWGEFTSDRWITLAKGPVSWKTIPFDDVIMTHYLNQCRPSTTTSNVYRNYYRATGSPPWSPQQHVSHDDTNKWKLFPCYWPFVRGIHRSSLDFLHKGQWHRAIQSSDVFFNLPAQMTEQTIKTLMIWDDIALNMTLL